MNKQHTLDLATFAAQNWLVTPEVRDILFAQLVQSGQITLTLDETPVHYADYNWSYYNEAPKKNSTAIVSIIGVIYPYYASYVCEKLRLIYADKNVSALVVRINSPGGAADAGYQIAAMLEGAPIPTWAHVEFGQANSAGFMIGCACDGFSASRANDRIGSIGTYISYQDWSKYYEKLGVVSKEIYADQSTEKNHESREAAKGNFKPLEKYVTAEAAAFIDYVKSRRTSLNTKAGDPFTGRVFSATDAKAIGLIDEIFDLKAAVKAVNNTTQTTNANPRTTMIFGYVKAEKLLALKGIEASALTAEQIKAANEELSGLGINAVALISQAEFTAMLEANAADQGGALATAQADVVRLKAELKTAQDNVSALTTERDGLSKKVAELGGESGAQKTKVEAQSETQPDAGDSDEVDMMALDHMASLKGTWLDFASKEGK